MCERKKGLSDDKILQFLSFFRLWGHDEFVERGGIYKLELKDNKIVSNGGFFCNGVRSLANYSDHAIAFSDTGDYKIKVLNPDIKKCFVLVGDGQGTRDGSKTQFSQPKGIFNDMKTLFTVNTSTAALPMTSNVSSLLESDLKYLHLLAEKFGIHLKKEAPLAVEREPAIERRELLSISIWPRVCWQCEHCYWHAWWKTGLSRNCLLTGLALKMRDDYSSHCVKWGFFWTGLTLGWVLDLT